MARTISEIKDDMTQRFLASEAIQQAYKVETDEYKNPTKTFEELFSKVSIESIFFYVVAFSMWTMEKLFDLHKVEVEELLANKHPHTLRWYAQKAKAFMYGYKLNDQDVDTNEFEDRLGIYSEEYDTSDLTEDQIRKAQIITYAACQKGSANNGRIILELKVAKGGGGNDDLTALNENETTAFQSYMEQIKDAGVYIKYISQGADHMKQDWLIYYDPQILNKDGNRLDGSETNVVEKAIKNYLKNLPFNGRYVKTYHIDAVQAVPGVKIPILETCKTKFHQEGEDPNIGWSDVKDNTIGELAYSGWYKFYDEDIVKGVKSLNIKMEPYFDDKMNNNPVI